MEIIEDSDELLSNRQVLDFLKHHPTKKQANLATILYETTSYLESSPAASSTLADIAGFLDIIKERGYNLSKPEKVQLVNLKPKNETELIIIIDNLDEKLDEQQRADLLQLIEQHLEKPETKQPQSPNKRHKR